MENYTSTETGQQLTEQIPIEETEEYQELFLYSKAVAQIKQMIGDFRYEQEKCKEYRAARYADIDIDQLRESEELLADETMIVDRLIDGNIMRSVPDKINFLISDGKLGDFKCVSQPGRPAKELEKAFTDGLTYAGWYKDWNRTIDGSELFGLDYMEVVFDQTKPLHVGVEHIGYDKLFYNRKVENIQDSERVIRCYEMTIFKLKSFRKFNPLIRQQVSEKFRDTRRNETIKVYKIYTKFNNCVYVHWYTEEGGAEIQDWLAPVEKLYIGMDIETTQVDPMTGQAVPISVPLELDVYPIFTYVNREDEQDCQIEKKGRGFLDMPMQECNTAIISGFVNSIIRASNVYGSPKNEDGDSGDIKQLDIVLKRGKIFNRPIDFWNTPMPDASVLQAIAMLQTMNAQSAGKFSFATNNRKDSRKTAEELQQAASQENKVKTTELATFSEFVRLVLSFCWLIVQMRAKQGKIQFMPVEQQDPNTLMTTYQNDLESIMQVYEIRPAGEASLEREATALKMMQDWPVIQTTPLAGQFLSDYIMVRYPEKAEQYVAIMKAGDPGKALVAALGTILQQALDKEDLATMTPEERQQLVMIQQQAQQYLAGGPTNGSGGNGNAPAGAQGMAAPSNEPTANTGTQQPQAV